MELTLRDGRHLGYGEFGDPAGRPCLLVPGFSSSRWVAGWAFTELRGIRLISVDRPGYGRSTPHPDAGFVAWAQDAGELIDHLDLGSIAVIGLSMGAGPALALAATRPVAGTTILGGMAPTTKVPRPANRGDALYWRLARYAPWLLRRLCDLSASAMGKVEDTSRFEREPALRELLSTTDARNAFLIDLRESARQGGGAMAEDLRQYLRPWGFDLADVRGPVQIWHGLDDPKVPIELARGLADQVPHATTHFLPGGHFLAFEHMGEILAQIS
jgi:pimeloyl-ACP methyl ester carboxylesterase